MTENTPNEPLQRPGFVYHLGRAIMFPLAKMVYRIKIEGTKNVPLEGPVIIASNHLSFIDSIVIPVLAPRRVQFLAKSAYFEGTGVKGWFSKMFFTSIGAVGVRRGAGQAAQEALEQGRQILEGGNAFAIYPEGTRSLDGRLYKGRTGVAWLALTTGAKVVPVGLIGTNKMMPVGAKIPRFAKVKIRYGEPIDVSVHGAANSGRARRLATDEIMAAIHALSEQELANEYNESPPHDIIEKAKRALWRRERL
ncbi:1-acyl-sn-glycerol-3-phosphate acyltransferase [Mycetocola lacteus]|uniref:1-acyl-sn-glycerol-3-phosphate acyltransferase n=1 Tax=Mycetocola lacteus TaxID=76637 RepID=A0A3L7AUQ2_9MICO|nr:lysophospholipid acyltransferase family protein [Mycetocola lacteus]RLP83261.1 1-acyl-sn-glycerol-3-phosphate acyltransferase [Mycetocola lacteus]